MKQIKDLLKREPLKKYSGITNERQLLIKDFLDKLNQDRQDTKYKPLTARVVAIKVSHLSNFDLKYFYQRCQRYKGEFSKAFFGSLK